MIILNQDQEKVVNAALKWFRYESEQIFEIEGQAGTGKSVVLMEIVRRLGLRPDEYMPMAYTGQASIIMRLKGFPNAKSIHSSLYHIVKEPITDGEYNDPFHINTEFNTEKFTYHFVPFAMGELPKSVKLMVIDECYMVPRSMRNDILKHGIKVLVAGDSCQLPPINDESAFLNGYNIHYLNELMRQAADNPIIYLAHRARKGEPIHCGVYGNNLLVIEEKDLTNEMVLNIGNIVCGTNKTRDMFNYTIRSLMGRSPYPEYGDRVICRNNNWEIEMDNVALANGLTGYISSPIDASSFQDKEKTIIHINFKPDLLNKSFLNLKANYEYIISDYSRRNEIKNNKFSRGELFEYAYALTTHLSQGAEYYSGIFYEEFLRPNIQNQLIYTGITRFKNSLIYVKKGKVFY